MIIKGIDIDIDLDELVLMHILPEAITIAILILEKQNVSVNKYLTLKRN